MTDPKTGPKTDPCAEPKVEPKATPKADPKVETQTVPAPDAKAENDVRIDIHNISTIAKKYRAAIVEIGLSAVQEDAVELSLAKYLIEGTTRYLINGIEFVFYVQEPVDPETPASDGIS